MDIHIEKKINFRRRRPKQIADDAGATKKTKNKKPTKKPICDYFEPTWIMQNNLSTLRSTD